MLKPSDSIYSLKMVKLKKNKLNNFQYIYIHRFKTVKTSLNKFKHGLNIV